MNVEKITRLQCTATSSSFTSLTHEFSYSAENIMDPKHWPLKPAVTCAIMPSSRLCMLIVNSVICRLTGRWHSTDITWNTSLSDHSCAKSQNGLGVPISDVKWQPGNRFKARNRLEKWETGNRKIFIIAHKGLTKTCQDSWDGPSAVLSQTIMTVSLSTGINRCRPTQTVLCLFA